MLPKLFITIVLAFNVCTGTHIKLINKTPCCLDRITSSTCQKIKQNDHYKFQERCTKEADFAMIQCCASCFNSRFANSSKMYEKITSELLQSPLTSPCADRRGSEFCKKLVDRRDFLIPLKYNHIDCTNYPFAFRECRLSCGYCSSGAYISRVKYDYNKATSTKYCNVKTYFALEDEDVKQKSEFNPLSYLKISDKHKPDDYFVVTDHDYSEYEAHDDYKF